MKELYNLFLFIAICFVLYLVFKNFNYNPLREGMTDASGNSVSTPSNGVAGNASAYSASLKSAIIKANDTFLISKYRSDYESVILNLDDLINTQMLNIALNINQSSPQQSLIQLGQMNQAKGALNSIMKYLDSQ
jgi:DhnA family fructose-bisphosphate aldolase class Ia